MNRKINVLVVNSDVFGVGHWRFIEPHIELQKQFPDEFYVEINATPDFLDVNYIQQFDIIFGHKEMVQIEKAEDTYNFLKQLGIKLIMDIDDAWELPITHPQYQFAKQTKYAERVAKVLPLFDYVTTTTEYFAKEISKHNKNAVVFPNAVDPNSKKFKNKQIESERTRIFWAGGSTHIHDLKLLTGMFQSLNEKYKDKVQMVLAGFDTRGSAIEVDANGQQHSRPFKPKEVCWYDYEKIFTSNYKNIPKEYFDWLMKFKNEDYPDVENESYRRVWTKPITTYSLNYNLADIVLAPLIENKFNMVKSQLKVIESGFFKKPIICSDIEPYRIDIKHGVNGFLVKNDSKTKDWAYYIKKLIDDPALAKEMGENLYETVKDKYDVRNISKQRAEFYKSILGL